MLRWLIWALQIYKNTLCCVVLLTNSWVKLSINMILIYWKNNFFLCFRETLILFSGLIFRRLILIILTCTTFIYKLHFSILRVFVGLRGRGQVFVLLGQLFLILAWTIFVVGQCLCSKWIFFLKVEFFFLGGRGFYSRLFFFLVGQIFYLVNSNFFIVGQMFLLWVKCFFSKILEIITTKWSSYEIHPVCFSPIQVFNFF